MRYLGKAVWASVLGAILVAMALTDYAGASVIGVGLNKGSYRDFENFYDANSNGMFDVGDRQRGVLHLDSLDRGGSPVPLTNEVTAIFDIEVRHMLWAESGIKDTYDILYGPATAPGVAGTELATPSGGVPAGTIFNPLGPLSGIAGTGPGAPEPMIVAFEGPPNDLAGFPVGSPGAAEAAATNGTLQGAFTMLGDMPGAPAFTWGASGNGYWFAHVEVANAVIGAPDPIPIGFPGTTSFGFGLEAFPGVGALSQFPYTKLTNPEIPLPDGSLLALSLTAIQGNTDPAIMGPLIGLPLPPPLPQPGTILFDITGGGSATPIPVGERGYGAYYADSDDPLRISPTPEPAAFFVWALLISVVAGATWFRRSRGK